MMVWGAVPPWGPEAKSPWLGVQGAKSSGADEFLANETHILQ